jgi:hypothetical protein
VSLSFSLCLLKHIQNTSADFAQAKDGSSDSAQAADVSAEFLDMSAESLDVSAESLDRARSPRTCPWTRRGVLGHDHGDQGRVLTYFQHPM